LLGLASTFKMEQQIYWRSLCGAVGLLV